jgi:hypothetical protein
MADAPATDPRDVLAALEQKLRRLEGELRGSGRDAQPRPLPADPPLPAEQRVRVEAAPFADLAALDAFRAAVAAAPGARDVYLRSFDAGRAVLEVRPGGPGEA